MEYHLGVFMPPIFTNIESFLAFSCSRNQLKNDSFVSKLHPDSGWHVIHAAVGDTHLEIAFKPKIPCKELVRNDSEVATFILGDDMRWQECLPTGHPLPLAATITWDPIRGEISCNSSRIGLPPLFLYERDGISIITSDIHLLRQVPSVRLTFESLSIIELLAIGYPRGYRTLFRNLNVINRSSRVVIGSIGRAQLLPISESRPTTTEANTPTDYPTHQQRAFRDALTKIDLSDSYLSLTAGLDSRTILTTLADYGIVLPTVTITGPRLSLDAILAQRVSKSVGARHTLVELGSEFRMKLPELIVAASRLSGGIASTEHAHTIYFYQMCQVLGTRRLSGILGNQVGRGGMEQVSFRGADPIILSDELLGIHGTEGNSLLSQLSTAQITENKHHLLDETFISSVGEFSISHNHAIQQSPYADPAIVDAWLRIDHYGEPAKYKWSARFADLRHRFVGQQGNQYWQRGLIAKSRSPAADFPINWGWKASGGFTTGGLLLGLGALADAYASRRSSRTRALAKVAKVFNISGLHEVRNTSNWLDTTLSDFLFDTLTSREISESGIFNNKALTNLLDGHRSGRKLQYTTVSAALDVALAYRIFCC